MHSWPIAWRRSMTSPSRMAVARRKSGSSWPSCDTSLAPLRTLMRALLKPNRPGPPSKAVSRRARFGGALAALLCCALQAAPARAALPSIVEIDDTAGRVLDAQSAKRLIRLELAEIDGEGIIAKDAVMYFRIFATPDGTLTIELWDRGRLYGDRHVSSQGSEPLRAR